ncbi:hypothetical protein Ddye_003602 [Dipteronia dyeriana]|uniref:Uncharacterized protein n=1 Tax=Dipteronia dyeriana TaxID=168575 RepID=A0AAD9XTA4_9ROSI|nr:hypothetical protein Ddye_003602 [Dipteronia dyeriana]
MFTGNFEKQTSDSSFTQHPHPLSDSSFTTTVIALVDLAVQHLSLFRCFFHSPQPQVDKLSYKEQEVSLKPRLVD